MKIEQRSFSIELREIEGGRRLVGTPIVYNKRSEDMGFFEIVAQNAAREALKISDVRLLYGHNDSSLLPIARQSAGTLRLVNSTNGVDIEADPPKRNSFVDALIESIERKDIREMSFGFTVEEDAWEGLDTDRPTRTITKIGEIFDVSYVAFAAYNDTSVGLRNGTNIDEAMRSLKLARNAAERGSDSASERARRIEILKLNTQIFM